MNILFAVYKVNDKSNPNINLVRNLENALDGHNIYYMGFDTDKTKQSDFCFYYPWEDKASKFVSDFGMASIFERVPIVLRHPVTSIFGFCKMKHIDIVSLFYKKHIEKICRKYNIDAVVSVSLPFYTAKGMEKAKISAKKIMMMFDPYALHYYYKSPMASKAEKKCIAASHHVFVPALIAGHYNNKNVESFEFPCLLLDNSKSDIPLLNPNKTNLVFAGNLYSNIRSPEPLYRLVQQCGNPNLHITIVGGVFGNFSDEFNNQYSEFIKEHVTMVGRVSKEQARLYINEADILVNIGNTIDNMLPSKVLECISTGKRVLNLCQIENCPSLPYFEKYGNSFNIYTKAPLTDEIISSFTEFVQNDTFVPQSQIVSDFAAATPQYVAQQLIDAINKT